MKNNIYVIIIVVCFLLAALIAYKYIISPGGGGGFEGISASEMTWVKCTDSACNAEYEMSLRDYFTQVKERTNPLANLTYIICDKCGKATVLQAIKCENPDCGKVFVIGSVPNDFQDRCPECKHSKTEEIRKQRKAGGQ